MKRQYHLLRFVSLLFKIVAIVMLLVGLGSLAFGLVRLVGAMRGPSGMAQWAQVAASLVIFGWGLGQFMVLFAVGEGLNVLMAIEENTRATSMRLVRLLSLLSDREEAAG